MELIVTSWLRVKQGWYGYTTLLMNGTVINFTSLCSDVPLGSLFAAQPIRKL
jgi:hypothetical protein